MDECAGLRIDALVALFGGDFDRLVACHPERARLEVSGRAPCSLGELWEAELDDLDPGGAGQGVRGAAALAYCRRARLREVAARGRALRSLPEPWRTLLGATAGQVRRICLEAGARIAAASVAGLRGAALHAALQTVGRDGARALARCVDDVPDGAPEDLGFAAAALADAAATRCGTDALYFLGRRALAARWAALAPTTRSAIARAGRQGLGRSTIGLVLAVTEPLVDTGDPAAGWVEVVLERALAHREEER